MLTKETLIALQEGQAISSANSAIETSHVAKDLVALPSDYKLHDLENMLPLRRRARGSMATSSLTAFAAYATAHGDSGTSVFVDKDAMHATAVLNLGTPSEPGHADNKAVLKAEKTAVYRALLAAADGVGKAQKAVAEFLEDWAACITCFASDDSKIDTRQAVAAVRKITIDSTRKIESEEQSLGATRSAFESVQASSKDLLPVLIRFDCVPYSDLTERVFVLRLGVLTGEAVPKITLRIVKFEEQQESMADELANLIAAEFDDNNIAVLMGVYARGQ